MGGGAGRAERREEEDRDLLDWLYLSSRLALLLSIVYFYSSITRLLIVLGLAGSFYAFQLGWWFAGREERRDQDRDRRYGQRRERREGFRERVRLLRQRIREA